MKYGSQKKVMVMVQSAMLAALIVVLQTTAVIIKIGPLPMSLVLVPIVIGACLLGAKAGAFLGFVFGLVTMIMGITGADGFSLLLFQAKPFWFIVLCLLKATMAGLGSALIYQALGKALKGKNITVQTVLASISAPVINTGIFVVGMLIFYYGSLPSLFPDAVGGYNGTLAFIFIGLAGLNFVGEFVINLVLTPVIVRVVDIVKKKIRL